MSAFNIKEIQSLENSTVPSQLKVKVGDMILNSTNVHAKVESIDTETGEYRLVLQGTLQKEERKF